MRFAVNGRESDEREMLEILDWMPAEAAGWVVVFAGFAALAAWLGVEDRKRRARDAARLAQATPAPLPMRHRQETSAARDVARAAEVAAMQAKAALQIDAIELAYKRLLAQCAHLLPRQAVHPLGPLRGAPSATSETPRRSLAA